MSLPAWVIRKDQELDLKLGEVGDELMELRWHWTIDKANLKAVGIREYAKTVGRSMSIISADANGWQKYLSELGDPDHGTVITPQPGKPSKPTQFRELAKMGTERQEAAKAVARNTGLSLNTVTRTKRDEVAAVLTSARERAERRGTTVESEIDEAAERRESARKAAKKLDDERKARSTAAYISIEGDIGVAMQRLRQVLKKADGVEFSEHETELIVDVLAKLRALLNLLDLRFTDETPDINWDNELQKITE